MNYMAHGPARSAVAKAIKDGTLVRKPCEECGAEPALAHHDDYSKPLDVRWLCHKHHSAWHAEHGSVEPPPDDSGLSDVISLRVSEWHLARWRREAGHEPLAAWIRRMCDKAVDDGPAQRELEREIHEMLGPPIVQTAVVHRDGRIDREPTKGRPWNGRKVYETESGRYLGTAIDEPFLSGWIGYIKIDPADPNTYSLYASCEHVTLDAPPE